MRVALVDDESSWVSVDRGVVPVSPEEFDDMWSMAPSERATGTVFGRRVTFPRRTAAYGRDYTFSGTTQAARPLDEAPGYRHVRQWLAPSPNRTANGILVNWYDAADGDRIGAHSDDERALQRGADIVCVTWASSAAHFRRFRLTSKDAAAAPAAFAGEDVPGVLSLRNGDVLVMGGRCQETHKHEVLPPRKRVPDESHGRRISLTIRTFA